jgi:hypothetical protein
MSEKRKTPRLDSIADIVNAAREKMSQDEINEVNRIIANALKEHDLRKFQAGLARLGLDENHALYAKLMLLWDEFRRASR